MILSVYSEQRVQRYAKNPTMRPGFSDLTRRTAMHSVNAQC